jgi:hypothetical protein
MKICLQCKGLLEINEWKGPNCGWKPDSQNGVLVFSPELSAGSGDCPTTAFQILAELEGNHFWFKSRSSLLIFALSHYVCRSETFCDVGCGTDFDLSGIRFAIRLVGCDAATDGPFSPRNSLPMSPSFKWMLEIFHFRKTSMSWERLICWYISKTMSR